MEKMRNGWIEHPTHQWQRQYSLIQWDEEMKKKKNRIEARVMVSVRLSVDSTGGSSVIPYPALLYISPVSLSLRLLSSELFRLVHLRLRQLLVLVLVEFELSVM